MLIHATTIAFDQRAVMLTGAAGTGKSDLALRLIMEHGAMLVSDDQTEVRRDGDALRASPPSRLAGMIEVRHVGILRMHHCTNVPVALCVELVAMDTVLPRLPALESVEQGAGQGDDFSLLEYPLRRLRLPAYAASTPAKIRAALMFPSVDPSPV